MIKRNLPDSTYYLPDVRLKFQVVQPHEEILDSARIVASREYVRRHRMWDGKLSLCFEFQTPNSFGRWKYLRRVHFSILNCTRRLFLGRFQTFPIFYDVIQCGMVN